MIDRNSASAKNRAQKHDIDSVFIGRKQFLDAYEMNTYILKKLQEYEIDAIVLAGYLGIVGSAIIQAFPERIVNIHPALIPKYSGKGYYGMKIHQQVILDQEKMTGVTIHYVDEGIDTGRIIVQETIAVQSEDTPETLAKRVLKVEHRLLVETIGNLAEEWKL